MMTVLLAFKKDPLPAHVFQFFVRYDMNDRSELIVAHTDGGTIPTSSGSTTCCVSRTNTCDSLELLAESI